MGDWELAERYEVIAKAIRSKARLAEKIAAINAETTATFGAAAKARYGSFCTDAENALQELVNLRAEMESAGCDAAALAAADAAIGTATTICEDKRAIYTNNDFIVTIKPKE